jgi:hypothetical protein
LRTADLKQFEDLGVVLRAPFHLSFPFVFQDRSSIYMLPEGERGDELALYGFDAFPFGAKKVRVLLQGSYADSHLLKYMNRWFLFTTHDNEFCVYVAEDLLTGEFSPHPANPITRDPKISRSAGATIRLEGYLFWKGTCIVWLRIVPTRTGKTSASSKSLNCLRSPIESASP